MVSYIDKKIVTMTFVQDYQNPKKDEIRALLDYIRQLISNHELRIVPRRKNQDFLIRYNLVEPDSIYIILNKLTVNHFCECQLSTDPEYYGEILYIFRIVEYLMDFEQDEEDVEIYVKFGRYKEAKIADISFHDAEHILTLYHWER